MDKNKSALIVCLNPTFELTMEFENVFENEVNRTSKYFIFPSGKGVNVARVMTQLGFNAVAFTHLGGNRTNEFINLCEAEKIKLEYFMTNSPIRTCINIVNKNKTTSTELVQEPINIDDPAASKSAIDLFTSLIPKFDAVVITGTRVKGYTEDLYPQMVDIAKKQNKMVILDMKGKDLYNCLPYRPDIIKPNLSELIATFENGKLVLEHENSDAFFPKVESIAKELYEKYGTKSVISRGKFSLWMFDGKSLIEVPNKDVPVVNTIGCGDALTAGMTSRLLAGDDLEKAVRFGMACALQNAQSMHHGLSSPDSIKV